MNEFSKLNGYDVKDKKAREDLDELNTTVEQHSEMLTELINNIENKKYIFIGDSYGDGYSPDGTTTSWMYQLRNLMGLTSSNCLVASHGGAGFANPSYPFADIIDDLTADNDVTDILIAGGYNDLSFSKQVIIEGMTTVKQKINNKFPNAKIYIAFIGGSLNDNHGDIHLRKSYYIEGCISLGFTYLPNIEYVLFDSRLFSSDGIHPNQSGQNAISNALYQALNGGYKYTGFYDLTLDTATSNFNDTTFPLHLYSNNDISYLTNYSNVLVFNASTPFELNYKGNFKLGKLTTRYGIIGSKYTSNLRFNIGSIVVRSTSNPAGYYTVPAQIFINEDGDVYVTLIPMTTDDHSNYQSYESVSQVQIPMFTIIYPTDVL